MGERNEGQAPHSRPLIVTNIKYKMIKDIKYHPKYWHLHKEIYNDEFDSLDSRIREDIQRNPFSHDARVFNDRINRLVEDKVKESNNHSDIELF